MSEYFGFDCGCKFPIIDKTGDFPKIDFSPKIEHINLDCSRTWKLISEGNTKGCFQLESRLGQMMAKKLKPENIEQLSGLIAILRPGCLESMRDGKSITNHYIDKKNGQESIDYFHPALEPILQNTFGEMCYQEQAMQIAHDLAGFDLQEADMLRKAIGKKKPEEMAKLKNKFIDGCKKTGIATTDQAEEIFGWIEKSQRYSFNKSHSVSYAMNSYLSSYTKAHFPRVFFASYLKFAKDKIDPQQEIKELVRNANEMNIDVRLPDLRNMNKNFILKDKHIYFGLTDIKGVGDSVFKKLLEITNNVNLNNLNWLQTITTVLLNINSTASKALISSGALDFFRKNRTEMIFEYEVISSLTKKEVEKFNQIILSHDKINIKDAMKLMLNEKITKNRLENINNLIVSINNPPYSLVDKIEWLSDSENSLLGVAISCSKLDSYDISMTNTNCKEFKTTLQVEKLLLAGEVAGVNIIKTKKGKNPGQEMAFVSIEDSYGMLDSVIFFPEQLEKYKHHLFEGNVLIFAGNRTKTKDGLVVEKCFAPQS
jgi:DNA polymerase III subunit alpha